jgi:colanic acid/amylovoran biosynthesis glycosyltransferase
MAATRGRPLGVILNQQKWLPRTQGWIHTQAALLPPHIVPHVVCGESANLDQFALENFHDFSRLSAPMRLRVVAAAAWRLGPALTRRTALIAHVARRHGARLVHSHFGFTGYDSARAVRRLGLKHVVTFYGVDMSALPAADPRWLDRYRVMFSQVDQVLCEGPCMAAGVARLGCPEEKLRVHHLGIRLGELPFQPREWRAGEPLRVLLAASFREKKGIPYALEALARIQHEVALDITIIGDAGDSPKSHEEKSRILAVVAKSGLAPRVRFMGYQPWRVLRDEAYRHHIFMSPSVTARDGDTEGGAPVALIEMAATGMPVVSSRHADIPEVIEEGVGGLLAAERDTEGLADCLRQLLAAPRDWSALARAARGRIEQHFNAERQGVALGEIYERVSGG